MAKNKENPTADETYSSLTNMSFDERFKLYNLLKNDLIVESGKLKVTGEKASNVLLAIKAD